MDVLSLKQWLPAVCVRREPFALPLRSHLNNRGGSRPYRLDYYDVSRTPGWNHNQQLWIPGFIENTSNDAQLPKESKNEGRRGPRCRKCVIRSFSEPCVRSWCVGGSCSRGVQTWDKPSSYNTIILHHLGRRK